LSYLNNALGLRWRCTYIHIVRYVCLCAHMYIKGKIFNVDIKEV